MTKKWLAIGLKAGVSGGLIWYLLSGIDAASLMAQVAEADARLLAVAAGVFMVQVFIGGLRWGTVLKALETPLSYALTVRLFYIGAFFNQALPGGNGGDAARMYLSHKQGLSVRHAVNGVLIERVATVLALVLLVDVTQPFFMQNLTPEMASLSLSGIITVSVLAVVGTCLVALLDRLPETLRRWRVVRGLGNLGVDTRRVLFSPARATPPIIWSLIGHLNLSLSTFVLAKGLGIDVTLLDCIVLVPPVLLILTLPISIGGWGVREGAMVWGFGLVGVANEAALALSLLFGVLVLIVSLPGGIVWLMTRGRNETSALPGDGMAGLREDHENA